MDIGVGDLEDFGEVFKMGREMSRLCVDLVVLSQAEGVGGALEERGGPWTAYPVAGLRVGEVGVGDRRGLPLGLSRRRVAFGDLGRRYIHSGPDRDL
jgi:hypothetical protein